MSILKVFFIAHRITNDHIDMALNTSHLVYTHVLQFALIP